MAWSSENLKSEYVEKAPLYNSLCEELSKQVEELLREASIPLVVPLEARVKTLESILEKCESTGLEPEELGAIGDVAGLRIVVLFRRDSDKAREIIRENFEVLREEDTADRLGEDQFGYGSIHFEVTPSKAWLKLPTLRKLEGLTAEIQLRTGSQHIWAASSHVLQYKKGSHVPAPIRRSINRAAALLETVDLEFERVLAEREEYAAANVTAQGDAILDTDLLRSVLSEMLPTEYERKFDAAGELLDELFNFEVRTVADLRNVIREMLPSALDEEKKKAKGLLDDPEHLTEGMKKRAESGRIYNCIGLGRQILAAKVGEEPLQEYMRSRRNAGQQ